MNQLKNMLSIGAFANMTRLSIKALRLYDQLGLLQPRHVDPQSGYRYYSIDQLSSARMIRNMREMDMPLATIRQVLVALISSPEQAEALATEYAEMREQEAKLIREQVKQFIHRVQQEQTLMTFEVTVKQIPLQQVLSSTHYIKVDKLDETISKTVETMYALLKEQNLEAASAPFGILHGTINEQEDGPLEICMPINGQVKTKGNIQTKQLQGGNAACVMTVGVETDFPTILGAYDAAADWIQKNGYAIAEPPREVWHSGPGDNPKMEIVWMFK
ncbi:MAG: MerR family transcriptional regulator [Anaerolineales bacterium]|nr:MerR family transcriptional regulator [Anaerolineales bacterium]MBX3036331.1 MerR family transcriptional regulator [Anaerolineales bacterium]